jgi:hypothetical protein
MPAADDLATGAPSRPAARTRAVLCDLETRNAAAGAVDFEALEPVALRGKSEPIATFRPLAARGAAEVHGAPDEALGREPELEVLADVVARVIAREGGGTVVIEGEPGMGKSVLLATAVRAAAGTGQVRPVTGAATEVERTTPYFVWRAVFATLLERAAPPGATSAERLAAWVAAAGEEPGLSPLLDAVLPLRIDDSDLTAQMTGEVRADNTQRLLSALVARAAATAPLLLVIEDAHWLDSSSWKLLRRVCTLGHAAIFATTRPIDTVFEADAAALRSLPGVQWRRLGAFDAERVVDLIERDLCVEDVPSELAAFLVEKTGGNPFFVEQLLGALVDASVVSVETGAIVLGTGAEALGSFPVPDTLEGVVTARLDRLTSGQQLTVKIASVIGRVFGVKTLRDVHPGVGQAELVGCLDSLERLDIALRDGPASTQERYAFRHVIIHEVAYKLLLDGQRRELHKNIAAWYERRFADDLSPHHGLLAWHTEKAEEYGRAIVHLEKAGEQALEAHANREAVGFLLRALAVADKGGGVERKRCARWERQLGYAYHGLSLLPDSSVHLRKAARLLRRRVPSTLFGVLLGIVGHFFLQVAHRLFPGLFFGRRAGDASNMEATRVYQRICELAYFQSNTNLLAYGVLLTLNLAEAGGPSPELVWAYANVCVLGAVVGVESIATHYVDRAVEVALAIDDDSGRSYAATARTLLLYGLGRPGEAREPLREGVAIAQRLGDVRRQEELGGLLAHVDLVEGDFAAAREGFAAQLALARAHGDVQPQCWCLLGGFVSTLRLGPPGETTKWPEEALALLERHPVRGDQIYAYGLASVARRVSGDLAGALDAARRSIELMEANLPSAVYALEGYCGAVETAVALAWNGEGAPAPELHRLARRACRQLFRFARPFRVAASRAWLFEGARRAALGQSSRAAAATRQSLALAERDGFRFDAARAHAQLAHLAADSEHEAEALRLCKELGASSEWVDFTRPRSAR